MIVLKLNQTKVMILMPRHQKGKVTKFPQIPKQNLLQVKTKVHWNLLLLCQDPGDTNVHLTVATAQTGQMTDQDMRLLVI